MRILPALLLSFVVTSVAAAAPPAKTHTPVTTAAERNLRDFDFVTSKIAANYAGWDSKVTKDTRPKLEALTASLRARAATASDAELLSLLKEWLAFFRDRHTIINANSNAAQNSVAPTQYPSVDLDEKTARAQLEALGKDRQPIEGIWNIDQGFYRVAVLRSPDNPKNFRAIVLATESKTWQPGQIKAEFHSASPNSFEMLFRAGDHSESKISPTLVANGDGLVVPDWANWIREWPTPSDPDALPRFLPSQDFFLKPLSSTTLWLRIPTFSETKIETIKALLASHSTELSSTPNLIIDIRNNGGGSDFAYDPLIPFLYTRPIIGIGVEDRATADNIALRHKDAEEIRKNAPEVADSIEKRNSVMKRHLGRYVANGDRPFGFDRRDSVLPSPKRIAVLMDSAGSTAEQFLLAARQSRKVTLFGYRNSAGVLDFANVVETVTPSGRFKIQWATSRSMRLPDDPVDPEGIPPDIRIPENVPDPVKFAAEWLERQVD